MTNLNKINVALFGFGHLGKWHADKIKAHSSVVNFKMIIEPNEGMHSKIKELHPDVPVYSSVENHWAEFDAGIIVTPTSIHAELIEKLLKNEKHVFCEKPLTHNLSSALKIKELLIDKKNILQVGHSERYHAFLENNKNWIDYLTGTAHVTLRRVAPFKGRATDVDVISDLMIHDIDLMNTIIGKLPKKVSAKGYKIRTDKWDYVNAHFAYENEITSQIIVGRNQTLEIREIEIVSENGTLTIDLMKNAIHKANGKFIDPDFVTTENYEKRDHLLFEHRDFYHAIESLSRPKIGIVDAIQVLTIMDGVSTALEQKKEVVF